MIDGSAWALVEWNGKRGWVNADGLSDEPTVAGATLGEPVSEKMETVSFVADASGGLVPIWCRFAPLRKD